MPSKSWNDAKFYKESQIKNMKCIKSSRKKWEFQQRTAKNVDFGKGLRKSANYARE